LINRDKTSHLAWCALVALQLARQDGLISSESQENLFIMRWFALAKKQRRFSRDLATDIDWVLNQGRSLGIRARLKHKLDYIWRSCTGELLVQDDMFRLTYAMELATVHDWVYQVLNDRYWSGRQRIPPSASVNNIYLHKSTLDIAFREDGKQLLPVPAIIYGQIEALNELLKSCGWIAIPKCYASLPQQFTLMSRHVEPGKDD